MLANLLRRKVEIEEKMTESIETMRVAYDRACTDVLTVVKGRLNDHERK